MNDGVQTLEVKDASGNVVPTFPNYQRGVNTVICNQTGSLLRLPQIQSPSGEIMLEPGESVDLEDLARPGTLEYAGLGQLYPNTATFHPKGTKPVGKAKFEQKGPKGKPNWADKTLNEVIQKEKKEDDRTKKHTQERAVEPEA